MTAPVSATREVGLKDLLHLYNDRPWTFRLFVAHRWWHARVPEVARLVPEAGVILELGCGHGVFANFLGLQSPRRRVIGVEKDARKVAVARGRLSNVEIITGDVLSESLPQADVVALFDVLHHLPSWTAQDETLDRARTCLAPRGLLIVKDVSRSLPLRWRATLVLDTLAYPFERFYFLRHEALIAKLNGLGFTTTMVPLWHRVPYAHYAVLARQGPAATCQSKGTASSESCPPS